MPSIENGRGYAGRMAVYELMEVNEAMRRLTIARPTSDQVRDLATAAGTTSMMSHAAGKILAGITTIDEVRRKVHMGEEGARHYNS